jgi:hypothetical protein
MGTLIKLPDYDRQVRAVGVAEMAGGAFFRSHDAGMILLRIHGENPGGTEFNADAAALAPGGIDENLAAGSFFGGRSLVLFLTGNRQVLNHEFPFWDYEEKITLLR